MITITYTEYLGPVAHLPNNAYKQVVTNFETCLEDKAQKFVETHWNMSLKDISLGNGVNALKNIRIIG